VLAVAEITFRLNSLTFYTESLISLEVLIAECTFAQISCEDEHCSIKLRMLKLDTSCG